MIESRWHNLNVVLVSMPFYSAVRPSLQLGLLSAIGRAHGFSVETLHLNLDFAARVGLPLYEALCEQRGLQLLDQTVALDRLTVGRDPGGRVRLRRHYRFEFTRDGAARDRAGEPAEVGGGGDQQPVGREPPERLAAVLEDPLRAAELARRAVEEGWPVREVERRAAGSRGARRRPARRHEAGADPVVRALEEALGEHLFEWFIRNKREEWDRYQQHVSGFELETYLPIL